MKKTIEERLSGGHPNSLGQTISVAEDILSDDTGKLFDELCRAYASEDEVVRLRVSSALKRVCGLHRDSLASTIRPKPEWVLQKFDWLIDTIGWNLDQPSAKWSIAQITQELQDKITPKQRANAIDLLKYNLTNDHDWIVQNITATTLADFSSSDTSLKIWLIPVLKRMQTDKRKTVSTKATRLLITLSD